MGFRKKCTTFKHSVSRNHLLNHLQITTLCCEEAGTSFFNGEYIWKFEELLVAAIDLCIHKGQSKGWYQATCLLLGSTTKYHIQRKKDDVLRNFAKYVFSQIDDVNSPR